MSGNEGPMAVLVKDAYKRYSPTTVILRGLNMKVPEGSIYGLLGPSGCGKTSLLSCIVGQRKFDSGSIKVLVKHKMELGYMPQEISLNSEFTISEVLHFYGRIYEMTEEKIQSRGKELLTFLELPPMDRVVANCSGGQQRRVSMAVTLLHNPKLLILDEPTVGVDPLLCKSIWDYFLKIVREQRKTIIITTHYIEEAKNANLIGLMRGGVLLAEEPPNNLLIQYHCDSLEEVFLKLSEKQEKVETNEATLPYPKIQPNELPLKPDGLFKRDRFMAQLVKSMNWTKRNWTVTMFVICLPALLFMILGQLTTHDGGDFPIGEIPLAFVNLETDDCRNSTQYLKLGKSCVPTRPISCRYTNLVEEVINVVDYPTYEDALGAVKKKQAFGIVLFPANFSHFIMERLVEQTGMSKRALEGSTIQVSFDMTDYGKGIRSSRELGQRIIDLLKDVSEDCGYLREMADIPIKVVEYEHEVRAIIQSIAAPYFCAVAFYTTMMYTSTAIIMERASGLFERSQVAGLTTLEIIVSQVVMQFFVMIIQNALSFFILYVVDGYNMRGSMPLCFFLILLVQFCGMSYGFMLSVVIGVEKNVTYAGIGTVLTLFMLTGTLWPTEAIHWLLKPMSRLLPVTFTAEAYYNVALRGWTIAYYGVYMGIVSSLTGIIVFMAITYLVVTFNYGGFT